MEPQNRKEHFFKALKQEESVSADPNHRDNFGNTFLMLAVAAGEKFDVLKWLNNGCSKDAQNTGGQTALIKSSKSNELEIMQILCSHSCNLNIVDLQGHTALHVAVIGNSLEAVQLLLSQGADVYNIHNENPLSCAWKLGHFDILSSLLEYGAEIKEEVMVTKWGGKVHPLQTAILNGRNDIAKFLIHAKLGIHMSTRHNCSSALHLACSRPGMDDIIEQLIEAGCPARLKNKSGHTPLDFAEIKGMQHYVDKLNKSLESSDRCTQANQAWLSGDYDRFFTAVSVETDYKAVVSTDWGGSPHALFSATRLGHKDITRGLVNSGAVDFNMRNSNGHTTLMQAATTGDAAIAEILLSAGADCKLEVKHTLSTLRAIHFAAILGNTDVVRLIVENDSTEVHSTGTWERIEGFTPLHFAAKYSKKELVHYLLAETDADWLAKTSDNKSALDIATDENIIHLLELKTTLRRHTKPSLSRQFSKFLHRKKTDRNDTVNPVRRPRQRRWGSDPSMSSSHSGLSHLTIKDAYEMEAPIGLAVVINNVNFVGTMYGERIGSDHDEAKMSSILSMKGFQVEVHRDLTMTQLMTCLLYYSKIDHTERSSFICCILSHGSCGKIIGVDGEKTPVSEITRLYSAQFCPNLKGKPKAFIINACQVFDNEISNCPQAQEVLSWNPDEEDFLIGMSTVPGKYSYRYETTGSPYIQQLADELAKYKNHRDVDLHDMMRNANKNLNKHFGEHSEFHQVSTLNTTLKRPFVLKSMVASDSMTTEKIKRWNSVVEDSSLSNVQMADLTQEKKEERYTIDITQLKDGSGIHCPNCQNFLFLLRNVNTTNADTQTDMNSQCCHDSVTQT